PSRTSPARRTWRASAASSVTIRRSPLTRPNARAAALARSTLSLLSRTTAEEESTERTDAMPGGSLAGCWAARSRVPRACRVLAPAPGALALIATRPPVSSAQAKAMTSEDSHASWYAVGVRRQQREGGHLGDIRGLFTAR